MRTTGVVLVGLVLLTAGGCSAADSPGDTPTSTSTSTATPVVTSTDADVATTALPGAGQAIPAGRYTRAGFAPAVEFEIGAGWVAEQAAAGFFDVEQDVGSLDVIAVQFAEIVGFETASEAAASFATTDHVVAGPVEPVVVGGLDGFRVLVETDDPHTSDPPIFREVLTVAPGPLSIASGRRLLVHLVDTPDGVLGVLVGGSIAEWERTIQVSQPVVDSISLG